MRKFACQVRNSLVNNNCDVVVVVRISNYFMCDCLILLPFSGRKPMLSVERLSFHVCGLRVRVTNFMAS